MKAKYYAVNVGRIPGVYHSWNECQAQVEYFKGAVYKGFTDINEAIRFADVVVKETPILKQDKYYAVKVGHNPGIYATWNECRMNVDGFNKPVYRKFDNLADAQAFIAPKYYVVKIGHIPGIYQTWDECKAQVDGFYRPVYRKFDTESEAKAFLGHNKKDEPKTKVKKTVAKKVTQPVNATKKVHYYAVKNGRVPGIYTDSEDARAQTKGFKNAIAKKFSDINDAKKFINTPEAKTFMNGTIKIDNTPLQTIDLLKKEKATNDVIKNYITNMQENELAAFVDGSFNYTTKNYGSGVVLIDNKFKQVQLSKGGNDKQFVKTCNIAGEIKASEIAINYAKKHHYDKVTIFFDFVGIEQWAQDDNKAKNPVAKEYKNFIKQCKSTINIEFFKVQAHTGITYNNAADLLAKKGAGIRSA